MDQDQKDYQEYLEYQEYQKHLASQGQAQPAPASAPPAADDSMEGKVRRLMEGAIGPEKNASLERMTSDQAGNQMALSMLPGAAGLLGATSRLGKIGVGAMQGAATGVAMEDPNASAEDKLKAGAAGGLMGGAVSGLTQAVSAIPGIGKYLGRNAARMTKPQSEQYMQNPKEVGQLASQLQDQAQAPQVQDQAAGAINASRKSLRAEGIGKASKLRELLSGKQVDVNPDELMGGHPELDNVLNQKIKEKSGMYGNLRPDRVSLDANEANEFKRRLQESAQYRPGTVQDPVQEARNAATQAKASKLRAALETTGGEGVKQLNQEMQEGAIVNKALRQGLKNPISFASSEAPDRVATMARASKPGDGGLLDFGNKLGAAKAINAKDTGSGIPAFLGKLGGRALMRTSNAVQPAADAAASPEALQLLMNAISTPNRK